MGSKVCECYKKALVDVTLKHSADQAKRFILLISDHQEEKDCHIIGNFQAGKPQYVNDQAMLWDLPPKPFIVGMNNIT
jgi:hypothetical protein